MKSSNGKFAQKIIAVVIIVTLLYGAGVTPVAMLFVSGVIFAVFMVSRLARNREVERIFDFYVAADAILREENRRWYGFEVAEVIEQGEDCLESLPDPPPLQLFTPVKLTLPVPPKVPEERFKALPAVVLLKMAVAVLPLMEKDPVVC